MNITSTTNAVAQAGQPAYQPPAPAPAPAVEAPAPRLVTREQLDAAVERANDAMKRDGSVRFAVHEDTNRVVVRIVDPQSMEIIREFPDTDLLDMVAKLQELAGMQVDLQM